MYESFFGLSEKPFSIQPDPSFLYWGRTHRLAYAMLEYGVLNHAGISVVTGEVGCGKTTLIHRLLDQLSSTHTVALLSNIQEGRGDLLSWVLMGFGQSFAGKSHVELFAQLQEFFISEYAKGRRVVLIIDEAQNLSLDTLEELRLLSNINAGKDQLLQLILVGQPQLKGLLNRPELLQLAQRVGSDFHLTPLSREEVHAYIETRLTIAGSANRIFSERAIDLIADVSRGVPRIINTIADTALVYAFSAEERVVSVETIRSVIRDKTDFGVFGIASDELAAPPLPKPDRSGPDAFVGKTQSAADPDQTPPPPPAEATRRAETPPAEARREPAEMADRSAQVAVAPRIRAPKPAPAASNVISDAPVLTGVVVLGIDPGASPQASIRSIGDRSPIVYSPVGASQQSIKEARRAGAVTVEPTSQTRVTVGRAGNAGYRQLKKIAPHIRYVQFIDSREVLEASWVDQAERFMERRPEVAAVEGGLHPQSRRTGAGMSDLEADDAHPDEIVTPKSSTFYVRAEQFESVGGFRGELTLLETADLSIRLRRRGGHVWKLNDTMATAFEPKAEESSWWRRAVGRGFRDAYAISLYGRPPERLGVGATVAAIIWGAVVPALVIIATAAAAALMSLDVIHGNPVLPVVIGATILVLGPLIRTLFFAARHGFWRPSSWARATSEALSPLPRVLGALSYLLRPKKHAPAA